MKFIYGVFIGKYFQKITARVFVRIGTLTAFLSDRISHLHIIKAYTNEEQEKADGQKASEELYKSNVSVAKITSISTAIESFINVVERLTVVLLSVALLQQGRITMQQLVAFFLFSETMFSYFASIVSSWTQLKTIQGTLARPMDIIHSEEENLSDGISVKELSGDIQFKNVTFSYSENLAPAVKNLSFTIPKGAKVAFVGVCGSGKTTIISLLERFYQPQEGTISIGGVNTEEMNLRDYRQRFCYVTQGTDVIGSTLREALQYGIQLDISDDELLEASRKSGFSVVLSEMPLGLDTHLSDEGDSLSGGQRQKLVLTREFLRDGDIILMDEPTAALDVEATAQVKEAMNNLFQDRTMIVVSHDLELIKDLDQIFVMNNGVLVGNGTHSELIKDCRPYIDLINSIKHREAVV